MKSLSIGFRLAGFYSLVFATGLAIFSIAAFRPTSTSPDVTRALSDVAWIGSELIWPMLAAGMALSGMLMLRTSKQPGGFPQRRRESRDRAIDSAGVEGTG